MLGERCHGQLHKWHLELRLESNGITKSNSTVDNPKFYFAESCVTTQHKTEAFARATGEMLKAWKIEKKTMLVHTKSNRLHWTCQFGMLRAHPAISCRQQMPKCKLCTLFHSQKNAGHFEPFCVITLGQHQKSKAKICWPGIYDNT